MFDGLVSLNNISFVMVFFEGLISFFSPCVLPIIPLYIGYLTGNAKIENNDGTFTYKKKKVLLHTIFFILGISTTFFVLGISFSALGTFFSSNKIIFSRIAGIIIIVLGLFQIGIFEFKFLQRDHRINYNLKFKNMNPIIAYIMGFTFSFAWTPCVGPGLASVLILASSAKNAITGNLLVIVYALGFIIPFLLLGLFTTHALNFIKKNKGIVKYTIKIGGALMIIMGIMTFTGWLNNVTGYLNSISKNNSTNYSSNNGYNQSSDKEGAVVNDEKEEPSNTQNNQNSNNEGLKDSIDFTLTDQYENTHKLSDYKGKTVFLNFWATWCPPCRTEMPHIEALYNEYNYNNDDVVILGVAQPGGQELNVAGIKNFLKKEGYTFPVLFDESGEVFANYGIRSLPTTFMINEEGKVYGYVSGALSKDQMKSIIKQTKENK